MANAYTKLMDRVRDVARLGAVGQLLDWDQETYMPANGVRARAEQVGLIAGIAHERLVADETAVLLDSATVDAEDFAGLSNLRETRRSYTRAVAIPTELVRRIAVTTSLAKDAWSRARAACDFPMFSPLLAEVIELKKQVAQLVGYETEPYDALMDEYEPGVRVADVEPLFEDLHAATVDLLNRIKAAARKPDASILTRSFPCDRQARLSRTMAESLGFDFQSGRLDTTVHPFCTSIGGAGDVRITTRYDERFLSSGLFGTLHETGHALYEQGLLPEHASTPMGEAVSLGIHESQSRLWENMIGRGRPFWRFHFDPLKDLFHESLSDVSVEAFYQAINAVAPSLIRVEADELTYNLHIIVRFEIERALVAGQIGASDVPAVWNEKMGSVLGVTPPDDRQGCLQDIHWSMGALGYFPTYTLGNLYAAQFFEQVRKDIPDLDQRTAANDHQPLLSWLRTNIHAHGQRFRAAELVERVTGKPLSIRPFVTYVTAKYAEVYGL